MLTALSCDIRQAELLQDPGQGQGQGQGQGFNTGPKAGWWIALSGYPDACSSQTICQSMGGQAREGLMSAGPS